MHAVARRRPPAGGRMGGQAQGNGKGPPTGWSTGPWWLDGLQPPLATVVDAGRAGELGGLGAPRRLLDLRWTLHREEESAHGPPGGAELVHLLRDRGARVVEVDVAVLVRLAEWLVHLDERPGRQPLDDAGLDAVREHLAVVHLQAQADPVRNVESQRRYYQQSDPTQPGHRVEADVELLGDDVVAAGNPEHGVERDRHRAERGAGRHVTRALEQVVVCPVLGEPFLQERVERGKREHDARQ